MLKSALDKKLLRFDCSKFPLIGLVVLILSISIETCSSRREVVVIILDQPRTLIQCVYLGLLGICSDQLEFHLARISCAKDISQMVERISILEPVKKLI